MWSIISSFILLWIMLLWTFFYMSFWCMYVYIFVGCVSVGFPRSRVWDKGSAGNLFVKWDQEARVRDRELKRCEEASVSISERLAIEMCGWPSVPQTLRGPLCTVSQTCLPEGWRRHAKHLSASQTPLVRGGHQGITSMYFWVAHAHVPSNAFEHRF